MSSSPSDERKGYQQAIIDAISHASKGWRFILRSVSVPQQTLLRDGAVQNARKCVVNDRGRSLHLPAVCLC
jgi:hypothetical protein